jgi:hypothetical protein
MPLSRRAFEAAAWRFDLPVGRSVLVAQHDTYNDHWRPQWSLPI